MRRRAAPTVPQDQSHILDVPDKQESYCPQCFQDIPLSTLRIHLAHECTERMVTCKEMGCGAIVPKSQMKKHLQRDCLFVRRREFLAVKSLSRPTTSTHVTLELQDDERSVEGPLVTEEMHAEEVEREIEQVQCIDCGDLIVKGKPYMEHLESGCRMRKIFCPNRAFGCDSTIAISQLAQHLKTDCEYEKRKEFMISNSKLRREPVVCAGCGTAVPLCELRRHEEEQCENRHVPCRNCALGCAVNVRLKDREQHEHVDGTATRRSCLYLGAGGSHLFINEDDMSPPWTVEYWLYRPSLLESTKNAIAGTRRRRVQFQLQFLEELKVHQQNVALLEQMVALTQQKDAIDASGVNVTLFRREAVIDQMAQLIGAYEDAAVASERIGRQLLISLGSAISCLEIQVAQNPAEIIASIKPEPPGEILSELLKKERSEGVEEGVTETETPVPPEEQEVSVVEGAVKAERDNGLLEDPEMDETVVGVSVFEWLQRLVKVKENFEAELATLAKWRDEAALVSQRASSSAASRGNVKWAASKTKTKKQLAEERKEKQRLRREGLKKALLDQEEAVASAGEEAEVEVEGTGTATREKTGRKKLHERLAEDVRTILGGEVIQSSNASPNKICIDVDAGTDAQNGDLSGSGGRVGFVTADGAFAFNSPIPRKRWVHIAIVCSKSPKKRTICYVNGAAAGQLSTSFALPMTAIGSMDQDNAFLGCLVDVRIWSVSRSAAEIRYNMHKLLTINTSTLHRPNTRAVSRLQTASARSRPQTSAAQTESAATTAATASSATSTAALVCWYTFEDARCRTGWSGRVSDISDQRFRTPIRSNGRLNPKFLNYLWLDANTLFVKTLPVPSYRDRNLCPFEIKRFRLAQRGRALMKDVLCTNGCGESVRAFDVRFHLKYECLSRVLVCSVPFCQEEYKARDRELHDDELCAAIKVRNRLVEQGLHMNEMSLCVLCSEPIRLRDVKVHNADECEHRSIPCPHKDCSAGFPAHMLARHLKYDCRSFQVTHQMLLVKRARQRTFYERPWGFHIGLGEAEEVLAEET